MRAIDSAAALADALQRQLNPENIMNCAMCKNGETAPGTVTVSLNRGETVVVIKEVPAEVCSNCGDYYLDSAAAQRVYVQADAAVARHAELEVLRFAA